MADHLAVAQVLQKVVGPGAPIAYSAFDGSVAGPPDPVVSIHVRHPRALNAMVTAPGELGLARAYVSGGLDLEGDTYTTLRFLARSGVGALTWGERAEILRSLGPGVLRPVPPPAEEVRPGLMWGLRHSLSRDSRAVSHHYDVSNRFYEWVLGPSMAYTCAVYTDEAASLEEAQEEKVDLVCRKLDLQPGQRLLDVGCGWGTMVRHAAQHYGVRVLGVTLSAQQAEYGQRWLSGSGLGHLAEIRHADYRSVEEGAFDAISSIGLTEHIGARNVPGYARFLAAKLRPEGRLLNHCITRPTTTASVRNNRGFINRYVFPDGEIEAVGTIVTALQDVGLEVRHDENLREHYAKTTGAWSANLDAHWSQAVAEVGEGRARVWKLYLAGSRLGFEQRRIELHQVLATRTCDGRAGMPLRPDFSVRGGLTPTRSSADAWRQPATVDALSVGPPDGFDHP
ncbi:MAG: class I SAM-dependent methyltransferase [Actinomycetota bacterium]|nr:class I SAM-dependent methyltransferase [Actinomycetota bacterium]